MSMLEIFHRLSNDVAREIGISGRILSITLNEDAYKKVFFETLERRSRMYDDGSGYYGSPICFYTQTGRCVINVDMVDRELKRIHNGTSRVCL